MNFQTVSIAEKLPTSDGLTGGYLADGVTPGPLLVRALDFINTEVGSFVQAIRARHLDRSTVVILSAKHGQSPQTPSLLIRIPNNPILAALDATWQAAHPGAGKLVEGSVADDGILIWLNDRSQSAAEFAKSFLKSHSGIGNDINGNPRAFTSSGLAQVFAGEAVADSFKDKPGDPRVPDVYGVSQVGVVFTGGKGKIAEHGGANPQDRAVPLLVSGAPIERHETDGRSVETTQIAPTILDLLGLNANALQAVRIEHTRALPLG